MLYRLAVKGLLLVLATGAWAQERLLLDPGHQMRIEGTSNVRKWGADVTQIEADLVLSARKGDGLVDLSGAFIEKLELRIPVAGISSKTKGLTGKIHKYLKEDEHPDIVFELEQVLHIERVGEGARLTARPDQCCRR